MERLKTLFFSARSSAALALKRVLLAAGRAYLALFPHETLSRAFSDLEARLRRAPDQTARLERLLPGPIEYLDVGARGGLNEVIRRYGRFFKPCLVEPDPAEAARLRAEGHPVIDRLLGDAAGRLTLRLTRKPGLSSTLEPDGPFVGYYAGGTDRFTVERRLELESSTIDAEARRLGLRLNLLKIDTQGTELAVLRGLGSQRPAFVVCEVSFLALYGGQDLLWELGEHMRRLGYLAWDLRFGLTPVPGVPRAVRRRLGLPSGLPVHGDAAFMPDWTSEAGRAVIAAAPRAWAALMLVYGHEDLLLHALDAGALPAAEAAAVRDALLAPVGPGAGGLYEPLTY